MAIAFDSAADLGNNGGTTNSLTTAFNNVAGDILIVGFDGDVGGGNDDITSVKYNNVSMTLLAKSVNTGQNRYAYVYYLIGPATGSHNVVISCTNNHYLLAGAVSYSGSKQSGQPDASTTNVSAGNVSTLTTSLTTVADNCWVVNFTENQTSPSDGTQPAAGAGSTKRTGEGTFGIWGLFDSNGVISPAGSYSMTTTTNTNIAKMVHIQFSIAPSTAVTATASQPRRMYMGMGS